MLLRVRLFQTFLISALLGVVYFNTKIKQTTVMNINGLLFAVPFTYCHPDLTPPSAQNQFRWWAT
jgi:hypothetical protein